jgi:lipoprotein-anchoring transpeptidase ErfK/SrfK
MSRPSASPRRILLFSALLLALVCAVLAAAAWTAGSSSAMASIVSLSSAATPTHGQYAARVEIAKPTNTASPIPTASSTPLPTEAPTNAPEPTVMPGLVFAEIVPDTPVPETSAYVSQTYDQAPSVSPGYGGNKYILIDISEQHLYAYEGDTLVFSFVASTGMNNATRLGSFSVLTKIPNAYGATWNIWMPNWLGIYWAGGLQNGIHALPILPNGAQLWAGYLGSPISYGCVVLGAYEAQVLYDWAELGTPVEIRW